MTSTAASHQEEIKIVLMCLNSEAALKTDCITAVQLGSPILKASRMRPTNTLKTYETSDAWCWNRTANGTHLKKQKGH